MKNQFGSARARVCKAARATVKRIAALSTEEGRQQFFDKVRFVGKSCAPVFAALLLNLIVHEAALAQTSGGPIFSGNASNLANIVREGLKLFAILLFCGGALGIGAAIWNKMWGKEWGNYAIGGGAAFAFGTIIAVIYSISQGRAVDVNTNF